MAFLDAWKQACSTQNSVLLVPENHRYLVHVARFKGPCSGRLTIQIDGTIVARDDPKIWDPKNPRKWLVLYNISKCLKKRARRTSRLASRLGATGECPNSPASYENLDVSAYLQDQTSRLTYEPTRMRRTPLPGDDCISIVNGSSSIKMKNIFCGPGHGIRH